MVPWIRYHRPWFIVSSIAAVLVGVALMIVCSTAQGSQIVGGTSILRRRSLSPSENNSSATANGDDALYVTTNSQKDEFLLSHFRLINADTNTVVSDFDPLVSGSVVDVAQIGTSRLSVEAMVQHSQQQSNSSNNSDHDNVTLFRSVHFDLDGTVQFRIETKSPYLLCGDEGPNYLSCSAQEWPTCKSANLIE